jgi:hypothetical protein
MGAAALEEPQAEVCARTFQRSNAYCVIPTEASLSERSGGIYAQRFAWCGLGRMHRFALIPIATRQKNAAPVGMTQ